MTIDLKIKGLFFGHILGDVLGYPFEFTTKNLKKYSYPYQKNMWSDDSAQMMIIYESIKSHTVTNIPKLLVNWKDYGIPEIEENMTISCGGYTYAVLSLPDYVEDPIHKSKNYWDDNWGIFAGNGSLMRTSIISTIENFEEMINICIYVCKLTHYDIRCVLACIFYNIVLHKLLYTNLQILEIYEFAFDYTKEYYSKNNGDGEKNYCDLLKIDNYFLDQRFSNHYDEFKYYCDSMFINENSLQTLDLDNIVTNGYVMKSFGVFLWTLKNIEKGNINYLNLINQIIYEGGDTDTNACISGALIGLFIGYESLPIDYLNYVSHINWIKHKFNFI